MLKWRRAIRSSTLLKIARNFLFFCPHFFMFFIFFLNHILLSPMPIVVPTTYTCTKNHCSLRSSLPRITGYSLDVCSIVSSIFNENTKKWLAAVGGTNSLAKAIAKRKNITFKGNGKHVSFSFVIDNYILCRYEEIRYLFFILNSLHTK